MPLPGSPLGWLPCTKLRFPALKHRTFDNGGYANVILLLQNYSPVKLLTSGQILSGAVILFTGASGYAAGHWVANLQRITENPLYTKLGEVGVSVNIDGFFCSDQENYGLFSADRKSISLCVEPHSSSGESVQSTLRHEAWHVLQACYNSKHKKKIPDYDDPQGLPDGNGLFFTTDEFKQFFYVDGGPKDFLGKDRYDRIIADYPDDQEKGELEAASAEQFFADQLIANWLDTYCQKKG